MHFQYKGNQYVFQNNAVSTCWSSSSDGFMNILFFFSNGSLLNLSLSWNDVQTQLQTSIYGTHQATSNFFFNVMTFLCFLGIPVSLAALHLHSMALFKIYGIAPYMMNNTQELGKITFYWLYEIYWRQTAHMETV